MREQIPLSNFQEALAVTPRQPDEDICAWLERVSAAARPENDRELPTGDREAGSEG